MRPPLRVRHAGPDLIERAVETNHFRFYDRGLSPIDCVLVAMVETTGGVLVTFDKGFQDPSA